MHICDSCVDMVIWFADGYVRVCLILTCKMVTPKLKIKNGLQSSDINHNTNLEPYSKHQCNPATPTVDNKMQWYQQIGNIPINECLAFMMNVSDNTRLSNTIHKSWITLDCTGASLETGWFKGIALSSDPEAWTVQTCSREADNQSCDSISQLTVL